MQSNNIDLLKLFFLILLGNAVSKSYLTIRGSNLTQKWFFVVTVLLGFVVSIGVTYIWSRTMQ